MFLLSPDLRRFIRSLAKALLVITSAIQVSCSGEKEEVSVPEQLVEAESIALIPHDGDEAVDERIRKAQERVASGQVPVASWEALGWAFVAKARRSFDAGYYTLAEACADEIEGIEAEASEALLLRGHVAHNLHRFSEAEEIARTLTEREGGPFDFLLLGDALIEQGKINEAIEAYQTAVDMRPDLQSYARVGWVRWMIGDVPGAIEATTRAVKAGSPQDPDSLAWALTQLAGFYFHLSQVGEAERVVSKAVTYMPDYPPALLLRGRMLMDGGDFEEAVAVLKKAAEKNPQPQYQWALLEAMAEADATAGAKELRDAFHATAERLDPRTYALYQATKGEKIGLAVELAEAELEERQDIYTHDAMAWALCAKGQLEEAQVHMDEALSVLTDDGRLYLHAAVIARRLGNMEEASDWFGAASDLKHTLFPSERRILKSLGEELAGNPFSS